MLNYKVKKFTSRKEKGAPLTHDEMDANAEIGTLLLDGQYPTERVIEIDTTSMIDKNNILRVHLGQIEKSHFNTGTPCLSCLYQVFGDASYRGQSGKAKLKATSVGVLTNNHYVWIVNNLFTISSNYQEQIENNVEYWDLYIDIVKKDMEFADTIKILYAVDYNYSKPSTLAQGEFSLLNKTEISVEEIEV